MIFAVVSSPTAHAYIHARTNAYTHYRWGGGAVLPLKVAGNSFPML